MKQLTCFNLTLIVGGQLKIRLSRVLMVLALFTVWSCEKDAIIDGREVPNAPSESLTFRSFEDLTPNDEASVNEVRLIVARTLAQALQNSQVRAYIHQKMAWSYDTDYEMIYIAEKDSIVHAGLKLADVLKAAASPQVLNLYGQDFFDRVTDISPTLVISIPDWESFNGDNWDVSTVPNVTAVLRNGSSYDHKMFDSSGDTVAVVMDSYGDGFTVPSLGVWEAEGYYLMKSDGTLHNGTSIDAIFSELTTNCSNALDSVNQASPGYAWGGQTHFLVSHNDLVNAYSDCMGYVGPYDGPPSSLIPEPIVCPPNCEAKLRQSQPGVLEWYCDCSGGGGGGSSCAEDCERDCEEESEHLVDFKLDGWGAFDAIRPTPLKRKFRFRAEVGAANVTLIDTGNPLDPASWSVSAVTPIPKYTSRTYKKKHLLNCDTRPCQGRWIGANYETFEADWVRGDGGLGELYTVDWYEIQGTNIELGAEIKLEPKVKVGPVTVSLVSASVGAKLTGPDVIDLGNQRVNYCEPIMDPRWTGTIFFRCD